MRWLVVEFIHDNNNVEVIPKNWLSICNTFCYWPTAESIINVTKAIKQCKPVDINTWKQHKIKIRSKVYDDFNQVSKKAQKACEVSELSETDASEKTSQSSKLAIRKREKHRNNDYLYNLSESDEDDNLPLMPTPPLVERSSQQKKDRAESQDKNGKGKVPGSPVQSFSSIETISSSFHKEQGLAREQQPTNIILNYNDFSKLMYKINSIIEIQRTHEVMLDNILQELQRGSNITKEPKEKLIHNFPIRKIEDLEETDKMIEDNNDQLVQEPSRIGGYDYKETTRRIMNKVLHDDVAKLLSFKGHKGKISFSKFKISRVVVEAVISDKKYASEKDVEALMGIWLSKATERLKNLQIKEAN